MADIFIKHRKRGVSMSRILLLEDDLSLINGLSFAFQKAGYALEVARTVREADSSVNAGACFYSAWSMTGPCLERTAAHTAVSRANSRIGRANAAQPAV